MVDILSITRDGYEDKLAELATVKMRLAEAERLLNQAQNPIGVAINLGATVWIGLLCQIQDFLPAPTGEEPGVFLIPAKPKLTEAQVNICPSSWITPVRLKAALEAYREVEGG